MRKTFVFLLLLFFITSLHQVEAQVVDTSIKQKDSSRIPIAEKKDTIRHAEKVVLPKIKQADTSHIRKNKDSSQRKQNRVPASDTQRTAPAVQPRQQPMPVVTETTPLPDSYRIAVVKDSFQIFFLPDSGNITERFLAGSRFVNISNPSVNYVIEERKSQGKEFLFYFICGLLFFVGVFKTAYPAYFRNLFRVFFNTSLRQTQLAEQLLIARFPSFMLNLFFVLSAGTFAWQLLEHFRHPNIPVLKLLVLCMAFVAGIYLIKFCFLKFIGWAINIQVATDSYIFTIFLVNKIMGIVWLPLVIIIAFAPAGWAYPAAVAAALITGLFLLARYSKGYSLVRHQISIDSFHFLLFIILAEIFPLWIMYKACMDYLV